jgi:hypothetical protein
MNNLITFSLLFQLDGSKLLTCSLDYIWEKYEKMIGFDPTIQDNEFSDWWQNVVITDHKAMAIKSKWFATWSKGEKIDPKKERVLNYLCATYTKSIELHNILNTFKKYIGPIENVNKEDYVHIHPLVKKFVNEYKERFKRELNLESLV